LPKEYCRGVGAYSETTVPKECIHFWARGKKRTRTSQGPVLCSWGMTSNEKRRNGEEKRERGKKKNSKKKKNPFSRARGKREKKNLGKYSPRSCGGDILVKKKEGG